MYAPILEIDTRKITENARKLHDFCAGRGVELAFATKGFSARPEVIRAALAGGITWTRRRTWSAGRTAASRARSR